MPALVIASRIYPTCESKSLSNSGEPEFECHPRLLFGNGAKAWMAGT